MFLGWHTSLIEDFANFHFLDLMDGLVENILEITRELLLSKKKSIDVVLPALLEVGVSLL